MKKVLLGSLLVLGFVLTGATFAHAFGNEISNSQGFGGSNPYEGKGPKSLDGFGYMAVGSTLEVHISNDKKVLVRGAEVTAVNGTTTTAKTIFGGYTMNWTIMTDAKTKYTRKTGGFINNNEAKVGDVISFTGTFDMNSTSTPTVKASIIKNWSANPLSFRGTQSQQLYIGRVKSVNSTDKSFVLTVPGKSDVSVKTSSTTQFFKESVSTSTESTMVPATFADVVVDVKAKVKGVWDTQRTAFTADRVDLLRNDSN